MTIPSVRLLLARVNCRTRRSKPCRSKTTRSSPRLIDSSEWLSKIRNQRGDAPKVFGRAHGLAQDAVRLETPEHLVAQERLELGGDVESGVEAAADGLDGDECADQEHEIRRDRQVVGADDADQVAKQDAQVDGIERQVGICRNQLGDVAAETAGIAVVAADFERFERSGSRGRRPETTGRSRGRRSARECGGRDVRRGHSPAERSPLKATPGDFQDAGRRGRSRTRKSA